MYREKHSIYRIQYYSQFQASAGSLGTYSTWIRRHYCIYDMIVINSEYIYS